MAEKDKLIAIRTVFVVLCEMHVMLTPSGEYEGGSFCFPLNVKHEDYIQQHLNALGKHHTERRQVKIVQ